MQTVLLSGYTPMIWFHNASSSALATLAVGLISAVSERDRARVAAVRSVIATGDHSCRGGSSVASGPCGAGPEKPMVADAGARR